MTRPPNLRLYPDVVAKYIQESGRVRTIATKKTVQTCLRGLQTAYPGKGVRDFTQADLTAFCLKPGLAPKTVKVRRAMIQSVFSWALFAQLISTDPSASLKFTVQPGNFSVRRHTWLTKDDLMTLLTVMPRSTVVERRDRALVFTGLLTGLRLSELVALRWGAFNEGMTEIRLMSKGQKLDTLGIPEALWDELTHWRKEVEPMQGPNGPVFPTFHYVLAEVGGMELECLWNRPLGQSGVNVVVKKAGRLIDQPNLCPHDMRRSYAFLLETEGFTLPDIARGMRHENMSTTSIYMDRNPMRSSAVGKSLTIKL